MIKEVCERCKWKFISKPNKCQTCKNNMLEKQDYYEKNDKELKEQEQKALKGKGQIYEETEEEKRARFMS